MAEAVVEERPTVPTRFYCHMCDEEINIPNTNTDYICPICSGGFVEELPPAATASNSSVGGSSSTSNAGFMGGGNDEQQLETLRGQIANLLASRNGPNLEININPSSMRNQPRGIVSLGPLPTGGGRVRPQSLDRLDDVLLNFLQSISVGSGAVAGEINPFDNSQLLFMGNLGDYAWGREGLDTIVTQLLNQMETSGPPPLAKDKIEDIPKVDISVEEVERKLQCSVCWEDFKINEKVRKLPCSHLYHEDCIVPWLNLHGTCPICRKSLNGEEDDDNDVHMDIVDEHQRPATASVCPIHQQQQQQQPQHVDNKRSSWAASSGGSQQQAPPLALHKREAPSVAPSSSGGYVQQPASSGTSANVHPPMAHSKSSSSSSSSAAASVGPPSWGAPQIYRQTSHTSQLQQQQPSGTHTSQSQHQTNTTTPMGNSPSSAVAAAAMLQQDIYAAAVQNDMYRRPTVFVSQAAPTYTYNRAVVAPPPAHNSSSRQVIPSHPLPAHIQFPTQYSQFGPLSPAQVAASKHAHYAPTNIWYGGE